MRMSKLYYENMISSEFPLKESYNKEQFSLMRRRKEEIVRWEKEFD